MLLIPGATTVVREDVRHSVVDRMYSTGWDSFDLVSDRPVTQESLVSKRMCSTPSEQLPRILG